MRKKVAVVGAGAVGLYYGVLLQRSGLDVVFQTRSGAAALQTEALSVRSPLGDFQQRVRAVASTAELEPPDLVIVSVKALPEIDYKLLLGALIRPATVILLLQNGLNNDERLAALFPEATLLAGLAFTCINRISPVEVLHADYGLINIGSLSERDDEAAEETADLFERAGIPCHFGGRGRPLRWKKLLWNVPFNCLSVVCGGVTTDQMVADPGTHRLAETLMEEVRGIAAADGCPLDVQDQERMMENTRTMRPYKTSMLIDYELGRPMEVEAILGEPLKTAERLRVDAPAMRAVYDILSFYNRNRG